MMSHQAFFVVASLVATTLATTACTRETPVDAQVIRPNKIMDFDLLYKKNCAGCHGLEGKGGAAMGLADPVFLAIADDAAITRTAANGVPGTSMPAFAQHSGGMLTDDQIQVIVSGIRARWAKPDALRGADPPPYVAQNPGDPKRGAAAYGVYCASCHAAEGRGGKAGSIAGSIVDPAYLTLVSDQGLRTTIIAGRPDMGAPDWRGNVPGKAMSAEDVSDVVAWLAAQRPQGGSR
jgi:cytochrome c oxidase cbb3-type subunit 3